MLSLFPDTRRSFRAICSEANPPFTSDSVNGGLFLLEASAGFASNETRSTQHDAGSCATRSQKLP